MALCERVWYLPSRPIEKSAFTFSGWNDPLLFPKNQPVHLEYCSGNGAWVAAKAAAYPQFNWVAVEKKFDRVRKIWSKIHNLQLSNLLVIFGEAMQLTQTFIPVESIDHIYINFPDPWPKKRHAKNRLLLPPFITELHRILQPQGAVDFVTDDSYHSNEVIAHFLSQPGWKPRDPTPYYIEELAGYGDSYFENLWREKGKQIRYHQFKKELRSCCA